MNHHSASRLESRDTSESVWLWTLRGLTVHLSSLLGPWDLKVTCLLWCVCVRQRKRKEGIDIVVESLSSRVCLQIYFQESCFCSSKAQSSRTKSTLMKKNRTFPSKQDWKTGTVCVFVCVCLCVCVCLHAYVCFSLARALSAPSAFPLEQRSALWQPRGFEWHRLSVMGIWGCRLAGCFFYCQLHQQRQ